MLSSKASWLGTQRWLTRSIRTKTVRIGCASGFWGDTPTATPQLIQHGQVKYLVYDYLSELTMSLLTAAHKKDPRWGYAPDFVTLAMGRHLTDIQAQGIKVITNAGGINTSACAQALREACQRAGVELKIAEVQGDNLIHRKDELLKAGRVQEMFSSQPLPDTVNSMTAYFGATPIAQALNMGADIVVTGRTADSALALGPLIHEFGWDPQDYDKMAAGSLAGHLIECGGQATGGLFTDWHLVDGYEALGFPIVEVEEEGDFVLSKPKGTGGLVNKFTVGEQLLYEIGDPENYFLPDVVCDFSNVTMDDLTEGVRVSGARGKAPTNSFKVSATYMDGYKATCVAVVQGGNATAKARKSAQAIIKRSQRILKMAGLPDFDRHHLSIIGAEDNYGSHAARVQGREAVIWMSVAHQDKTAINIWAQEIASSGTGMAPGMCGMVGGRPKASPCLKLFSFLHPKQELKAVVTVEGQIHEMGFDATGVDFSPRPKPEQSEPKVPLGPHSYTLEDLALARSGDKGNSCNIGLIARHPSYLAYLKNRVTSQAVADYFRHLFSPDCDPAANVTRYELPGIGGLNFVLENVLDGGGMASMRPDPLGKSLGQMLLSMRVDQMPTLEEMQKHESAI